MTLLWHDHFATAVIPLPSTSMLVHQNQTIRLNALGSFRALAGAMVIDTAMLYWLGGRNNVKGKPNENYAREQFELFTLGTVPQVYTEADVRQAAKVLTGWTDTPAFQSVFNPLDHDTSTKTVLSNEFRAGPAGSRELVRSPVELVAWIDTTTALARYDWGHALYGIWAATAAKLRPVLPAPADLIAWATRFGLASLSATTANAISSYLASRPGAANSELQEGVISLIVSSPDWMVL